MFIKPKAQAKTQVADLLGALAAELDPFIDTALDASLVPDEAGRWPSADGYEATVDVAYAMAYLYSFAAGVPGVQPTEVQAFSSEGTSFTMAKGATFDSAVAWWRAQSVIACRAPQLGVIEIEQPVHYVPRSEGWSHG